MWGDEGAYGTWASYLDVWQKDLQPHDQVLPRLEQRDFTTDTWTRLVNRIFDAIGGRLRLWSDAFSQSMSRADSEFGVGVALTQARVGLAAILALADHPSLPDDLRLQLREVVERQIRSAQSQLEQQLDRMQQSGSPRSVVDARRRTVRDNPLDAVLAAGWQATQMAPAAVSSQVDLTKRPKRTFAID